MAKQLIPLVKSGYLASPGYIPLVHGNGLTTNVEPEPQYETLTGDIVTFNSLRVQPLEALSCTIVPVQDLHGQSSPYPEGSTKNLFKATNYGGTYNGSVGYDLKQGAPMNYSITSDGFIEVDVTTAWRYRCFATDSLPAGTYTARSWADSSHIRSTIYVTDSNLIVKTMVYYQASAGWGNKQTVTVSEGDRIAICIGADSVAKLKVSFQVESGSQDTAEIPFENICPISGWSEAKVTRTGKNLLDADAIVAAASHQYCYIENGYLRFYTGAPSNRGFSWEGLKLSCPVTFSFTCKNYSAYGNTVRLNATLSDGTTVSFYDKTLAESAEDSATATVGTSGKTITQIYVAYTDSRPAGIRLDSSQIELGSSATAYEPFTAQTVTIDLSGTRYGGTLDVKSGVLTVTHTVFDLGDISWTHHSPSGSVVYDYFQADLKNDGVKSHSGSGVKADILCSMYPVVTSNEVAKSGFDNCISQSGFIFFIADSTYTDSATFTTAVTGQTLWVELATHQTVQLSANELTTLLGQNNVWSSCGQTTLTYQTN